MLHILIIGGYGNFGRRLIRSLLANSSHSITIAGRSELKATSFCQKLNQEFGLTIKHTQLNVLTSKLDPIIAQHKPDIVVNASGPFQEQQGQRQYAVARACISAGCHYIDLCDSREFVAGFPDALNTDAQAAGVMLVTGASTVPGLSTAVIDAFLPEFEKLTEIQYGISPGNQTERGAGTISSILSYIGKPFTTLRDGEMQTVYGWQDITRAKFGEPIGTRWMANCDIPDLDLLPARYKDVKTVEFKAGLELTVLHIGLWLFSWLTRYGLVDDWSRYSRQLTHLSEYFIKMGTDCGGMFVNLTGIDKDQKAKTVQWQIVAENSVGPNIPVIAPELVINRIAAGDTKTGAMPCIGLFTLEEFMKVARRWDIEERVALDGG